MNEKEEREVGELIEKDREEHDHDFSNLSKIEKCPKCGGEFDEGYLLINVSTWNESKVHFWGGIMKRTRPGILNPSQFPALRCKKCHFVTFDYTSEVERGTVKE